MIEDGRKMPSGQKLQSVITVIGAGPAGITIALQLAHTGVPVILLEAGGLRPADDASNFYRGQTSKLPYDLVRSRLRCLGGSSGHWTGLCSPLDAGDFVIRPGVCDSSWPLKFDQLLSYYRRSADTIGLGKTEETFYRRQEIPAFLGSDFGAKYWRGSSPPVNFFSKYHGELKSILNLKVLYHSVVTAIELHESTKRATRLRVTTSHDKCFYVTSDFFVLACGGIENARLLLTANSVFARLPGGKNIGRYFMEHPHFYDIGFVIFHHPDAASFLAPASPHSGWVVFQLSDKERQRKKIANAVVAMGRRKENIKDVEGGEVMLERLFKMRNAKLPHQIFALQMIGEQIPRDLSRVTLADDKDPYGIPRVNLNWQLVETEWRTYYKTPLLFAMGVQRSGLGAVKLSNWVLDGDFTSHLSYGSHHMGTTRMGESPRHAVVDSHGKLFGVENFYVAGSSVFSTGGVANPTFTIVALALRLADHLQRKLGNERQSHTTHG